MVRVVRVVVLAVLVAVPLGAHRALTWPQTSGVGVWIIAVAFQILSASFFKRMIE